MGEKVETVRASFGWGSLGQKKEIPTVGIKYKDCRHDRTEETEMAMAVYWRPVKERDRCNIRH